MMYWNHHDMSGWDWFAMSTGSVLLWALLLTVAILFIRNLSHTSQRPDILAAPSPEQVLADRFARGEIDEEDYRNRLAVLRTDGSRLTEH
ncbi:SHOCT domain-containing protein [Streptomyces sp. W16]|uniref:SHOCT domain-containing protein n=1 Tax=Streptomyces sp. W16 TaxID=3076631 RepID=UPI00295B3A7E|nr:SHOCT domain-containing protein [Streptomyces sp. W16]MDV9172389.1 SHOCT domain-containing protein [Streptomyces sp. W16]